MGLPWVRLDSNIASHDKVLDLLGRRNGHRSGFVYVCCLAYSGLNGTDGAVPFAALPFVHGTKADMAALVEVGLLRPTPTGWAVSNYADRQQLSTTTATILAGRRVASAKGNCVRWHGEDCGCWKEA